jgi:hypothetical protein
MPLPQAPREQLHFRNIEMRGYRRPDGLFEIDGHLTDTKTFDFSPGGGDDNTVKAGNPIHEMWLRLVIDAKLFIHDVLAVTDHHPFPQCPEATNIMASLKGLTIGAGWQAAIRERLGRADSCTHLREMLIPMGTAAMQSLGGIREGRDRTDKNGRPLKIDSCYAFSAERAQVMQRWPQFYTGPATAGSNSDSKDTEPA